LSLWLGSVFCRSRVLFGAVVTFNVLIVRPAPAQTADSHAAQKKLATETDISIGVFGQLTPSRTPVTTISESDGVQSTQTTQGTSPSAGVLGTFHQSYRPWLGYNVNFGYARFSENYSLGHAFIPIATTSFPAFSDFSRGSIRTNMYELSVAYAITGPRTRRFDTFVQFGGGGLFFVPTESRSPYANQTRPAMVFGVGLNFKLAPRLAIRVEYRGLFYKNPDFAYYSGNAVPIS
jgi:opacity protein-like surface antigen